MADAVDASDASDAVFRRTRPIIVLLEMQCSFKSRFWQLKQKTSVMKIAFVGHAGIGLDWIMSEVLFVF